MTIGTFSSAFARTPLRAMAKDAFLYIKMPKELLGGNIQVQDTAGHVISTMAIDHRKVYLDFFKFADGKYKVILTHDDMHIEFIYAVESAKHSTKRKHSV